MIFKCSFIFLIHTWTLRWFLITFFLFSRWSSKLDSSWDLNSLWLLYHLPIILSLTLLLYLLRFMPRVEIVQKHNTAARRLYIRGHNGKIYPYLVMNDACLTESRREERVLQLLRLLNPCLEKRKETTKRHLFFTGTAVTTDHTETAPSPWLHLFMSALWTRPFVSMTRFNSEVYL